MAVLDIDFDGTNNIGSNVNNVDNPDVLTKEEDVTHLNGGDVDDITNGSTDKPTDDNQNQEENNNDNTSTGELTVGDQIEYEGKTYTIVDNGDLVDEQGNVFKEAKDVPEFLENNDVTDEDEEVFDINALRDELDVNLTDDEGNTLEFDNTPAGVKEFINTVIDHKSKEIQEATLNRFYTTNPLVKQFVDYVELTGTPRGFGEIPDRSGIKVEEDNEAQQIAIIKMAANEFGNKTINDSYINWLRENGNLYTYAKEQLDALVDKDKSIRKDIETKAAEQRQAEVERLNEYWNSVHKVIESRVIGGYKIPENFTREINGKKVLCDSNDFFNFISNAAYEDEDGNRMTGYTKALNELTDEEYLNRELLDAWLMFTGGTYKDLVDMAIKENEVRKLVVKAKQSRAAKTVRVVKKQTGKQTIDDIVL